MDIHLDHLDSQTRSLVIELLRLDVEEAMTEMAGKEDQFVRDSKAALDTYLADLDAQTVVASDRTMAKSIVRAVHYDEGIIAAAMAQEKQADSDRKAALQLHETGRLPRPTEPSHADDYSGIDDERRFDLEAEYNLRPRDDNEGSDHDYPHRLAKFRSCAICFEKIEFRDLARMPCSHEYCRGCLRELFETVLVDETLYPPRCCAQRIPETEMQIQSFLGGDLLGKFLARKLEMETPNRTYCHRPDCSAFIPPQGIKCDNGTCPKCRSRTCCICKGASHQGSYCPQDESVQDLLRMASEEGWKRCFRCGRMVELSYGCNHISCRCGADFCYVCGAPWKETGEPGKCLCPLFDESELARQAEAEAAAQDQGLPQQPPAIQAQFVQQQRNYIVQNYACEHRRWFFKPGHYKCHQCSDKMHGFIFECHQCEFRACARCKRNRL